MNKNIINKIIKHFTNPIQSIFFDVRNLTGYKPFRNDVLNIKAFLIFIKYYLLK